MTQDEISELRNLRNEAREFANRLDRLLTNAVGDTNPLPEPTAPPADPTPQSTADMVTQNQLGFIVKLARTANVSADAVSAEMFDGLKHYELNKNSASQLIDRLKGMQPMRRVG